MLALSCTFFFGEAEAQNYSFSNVQVEGVQGVDPATVAKIAAIDRNQPVSAADLNDAVQRLMASGIFATAEVVPSGSTLIIKVTQHPIINVIDFEGNKRLKDEMLSSVIKSRQGRVFTVADAEADAAAITQAYSDSGRLAARVEPRLIDRGGNRVDLVFEIREGAVTEVERLSFVGNRAYSDRRLRQVLETKQAGIFHSLIQSDSYIADRIEFDKKLLTDFYRARGYIDFQVLGVSRDFSRERDAFFLTFNIREGLPYTFNSARVVSEYAGVDAASYADAVKIRSGATYTPLAIDNAISRMEAIALRQGVNFMNVVPRVTRNERNQTLDVVFALTKGPRLFVERIDIQGNATTLDQVIRRKFRTVEGDPFNPREIRESSERIRALGYFETADVTTKQGTAPDQVIVDTNVVEKPTGSLSFGASYSVENGPGFNIGLTESNFLGRGQFVGANISVGTSSQDNKLTFVEPAFLGRDLRLSLLAYYNTTDNLNSDYSTKFYGFQPSIDFPISEFTRLGFRYTIEDSKIFKVDTASSSLLKRDEAVGSQVKSAIGYTFTYDNSVGGIDPNSSLQLQFQQDFAGLGGDITSVNTSARAQYETKVMREEVTLRAAVEGGALWTDGDSRLVDRFTSAGGMRGFEGNGIGPRDLSVPNRDAVGGNYYAVAKLEAQFPIGLPNEYGITGGVFADVGSLWGLDNTLGGQIDDDMHIRSAVGVSLFWDSTIGPLRFNFSHAVKKERYDNERNFDFTVSTRF